MGSSDRSSDRRPLTWASSSKVRATPLARRIASQQGLDLSRINGTGPNGRVQSGDIRSAAGNGHAPAATGAVRPEFPSVLPSPAIAKPPVGDGPGGKALRLPQGDLSYREWTGSGGGHADGRSGPRLQWRCPDLVRIGEGLSRGRPARPGARLPGHGQTTIDAHGIDDIVNSLVRFLDEVADGPVELVGHSMGAVAAVRAALQAERKVSRLTLPAPAGLRFGNRRRFHPGHGDGKDGRRRCPSPAPLDGPPGFVHRCPA